MGEEINEFEKVSYRRRRREGEYIVIEGEGSGKISTWRREGRVGRRR